MGAGKSKETESINWDKLLSEVPSRSHYEFGYFEKDINKFRAILPLVCNCMRNEAKNLTLRLSRCS